MQCVKFRNKKATILKASAALWKLVNSKFQNVGRDSHKWNFGSIPASNIPVLKPVISAYLTFITHHWRLSLASVCFICLFCKNLNNGWQFQNITLAEAVKIHKIIPVWRKWTEGLFWLSQNTRNAKQSNKIPQKRIQDRRKLFIHCGHAWLSEEIKQIS